jgi:hypothetical protein
MGMTVGRRNISSNSAFEAGVGMSRVVRISTTITVAGTAPASPTYALNSSEASCRHVPLCR